MQPQSPSGPSESEVLVKYLSPVEIAYMTGFGTKTVLRWLQNQELKGVKARNQWRVHPDELKAFIERGFKGE